MSEKNSTKNQLIVRFKTPSSYKTFTADGAVAGEVFDDKVTLEFFIHKQDLPEYLIFDLDDEGKPISNPKSKGGFHGLTRERQFGLVMSIEKIVTLRDELNKILDRPKVKEYLKNRV
jgi:hypothetical protein